MTVFNCQQVLEKATFYVDNEVTDDEKVAIDSHLRSCKGCAEEYAIEVRISSMLLSSAWNPISTEDLVKKAMFKYMQKRTED